MIRIVLVRHGETVWHAENRYAGSTDIRLTERGEHQAEALAAWSRNAGLAQIHVSPLHRAQATAAPAGRMLGLAPLIEPGLRELDFGQGEGLTGAEMKARFPAAYSAFLDDPVTHPLPGGEDPHAAIDRGQAALYDIARQALEDSAHARVLVVTHNPLIRLLLCNSLGIPASGYRRIFPRLDNIAVTELGCKFTAFSDLPSISLLQFNTPILCTYPEHARHSANEDK